MAFENQAIYDDIKELSESRQLAGIWDYSAEIIANNKTISVVTVDSISFLRDYSTSYGDAGAIIVSIGANTYKNNIYPYRDNLQIKINKTRLGETLTEASRGDTLSTTYRAIPTNPPDLSVLSKVKDEDLPYLEELNIVDITFQISEMSLFTSRVAEFAGSFRDVKLEDLLKVAMGTGLDGSVTGDSLLTPDYLGVRGVDIISPTNDGTFENIVIPVGTRVVTIPDLLQKKIGVYSSGIGCYIQDGVWYIYPLRDYNLFNVRKKTLTIVNIPEDELVTLERTYRVDGNKVFALAIGSSEMSDLSQTAALNSGNGIRYVRSSALLDLMGTTSKNKVTLNRADTLKEFSIEERKDGVLNARFVEGLFTNNPFKHIDKLTAIKGRTVTLTWQNSDQNLLYPGMPVKMLYLKNGIVKSATGILHKVETLITKPNSNITTKEYRSHSVLEIFVKPDEDA